MEPHTTRKRPARTICIAGWVSDRRPTATELTNQVNGYLVRERKENDRQREGDRTLLSSRAGDCFLNSIVLNLMDITGRWTRMTLSIHVVRPPGSFIAVKLTVLYIWCVREF